MRNVRRRRAAASIAAARAGGPRARRARRSRPARGSARGGVRSSTATSSRSALFRPNVRSYRGRRPGVVKARCQRSARACPSSPRPPPAHDAPTVRPDLRATVERHRELLEQGASRRSTTAPSSRPSPSRRARACTARRPPTRAARRSRPCCNRRFDLGQPGTADWVATERSPWGPELGVEYPVPDVEELLAAQQAAIPAWRDAGPLARAALCVEMLVRINAASFEIGHAVMHTSRAGLRDGVPGRRPARAGPRARGRRLRLRGAGPLPGRGRLGEAAGQAAAGPDVQDVHGRPARHRPRHRLQHLPDVELLPRPVRRPGHRQRRPRQAAPARRPAAGDHRPDRPRGARRARLRPEPRLPGRRDRVGGRLAAELAVRPEVGIVDYTGSTAFGDWLEAATPGRRRSTRRRPASTPSSSTRPTTTGACSPTSRSRSSLYSGQMCTTPQNLLVPRDGIATDAGSRRRSTQFGEDLGAADRRPARRRRQGRGAARRRRQRRRARAGSRQRPAMGARRRRRPGRCAPRRTRTRRVRTPAVAAGRRRRRAGLRAGVLRAGGVPRDDRLDGGVDRGLPAHGRRARRASPPPSTARTPACSTPLGRQRSTSASRCRRT